MQYILYMREIGVMASGIAIRQFCVALLLFCAGALGAGAQCPVYETGQVVGTLESGDVDEISGLVASRTHSDVLWGHNDSGDSARIFAITPTGQHLGIYNILGVTAVDWEDLTIGPGPIPGQDYLYIADLGDNLSLRPNVSVYRVTEPFASSTQPGSTVVNVTGAEELPLNYPFGVAYDCETIFSDPWTGDLYFVTKELFNTKVFRLPVPHTPGISATLTQIAFISGPGFATAGDMRADGEVIALRGYVQGFQWTRSPGMSVEDAFSGTPCTLSIANETQGETLAYASDGCSFFSVSEGLNPPFHRYMAATPCADIVVDHDGDGLKDSIEASLCTDMFLFDTDADGISDWDEVTRYGNTSPSEYLPGVTHTDACSKDTDNDGVSDLQEINFGTDPLDENSFPELPVGNAYLMLCLMAILIGLYRHKMCKSKSA